MMLYSLASCNNISCETSFCTSWVPTGTTFKIWDYNLGGARVCITSSGNMGLGTDTPHAKLDVVGDISASGSLRVAGLNEGSQVKALYYNTTTGDITYDNSDIYDWLLSKQKQG